VEVFFDANVIVRRTTLAFKGNGRNIFIFSGHWSLNFRVRLIREKIHVDVVRIMPPGRYSPCRNLQTGNISKNSTS
jgi:hypothetical protein